MGAGRPFSALGATDPDAVLQALNIVGRNAPHQWPDRQIARRSRHSIWRKRLENRQTRHW